MDRAEDDRLAPATAVSTPDLRGPRTSKAALYISRLPTSTSTRASAADDRPHYGFGGIIGRVPSLGAVVVDEGGKSGFVGTFSSSPPLLAVRPAASAAKNRMAVAASPSRAPPPLDPPVTRMSGTNLARPSASSAITLTRAVAFGPKASTCARNP